MTGGGFSPGQGGGGSGGWHKGDVVENSDPASHIMQWDCVEAGNPGVWVEKEWPAGMRSTSI